jgi:threonine dehydrogenase-like Zn-dependent dehydrogenase
MNTTTIQYLSDGSIEILELNVKDPGENEVQIQGGVCGICSWDVATAKLGDKMYPKAPPGHEGMGHVVKVGKNVTGLKEGDRVAGGGFATLRNLPASSVYKIPESNLADEYWIVEPVSCAVTGLDHCRLKPGDRVAVIGAGFMGALILQGLLHSSLGALVAIDVVESRLELSQKLGVKAVYNSAHFEPDQLVKELKSFEFDVVVDTSGVQAGLDLATDIVKTGGLINLFGWIKGERATFNSTEWHLGGFTIVNSSPAARLRDPFPPAIRLIHEGVFDLRPLVTHVEELQNYPTLMKQILQGDKNYVKGVIKLSESQNQTPRGRTEAVIAQTQA